MSDAEKFEAFTLELAKLSKKYGIGIESCGGVYFDPIKTIQYSSDHTSGDLTYEATYKTK